jgi:alanine racemase
MHSGTDIFGVANLAEARAIRSVGKGWPILMLGACLPTEVDAAVRDGIMPTISTLEEAKLFSSSAVRQKKSVVVHLKIDTGMGRLGAPPDSAAALLKNLDQLPAIAVKGIYTHYSASEDDAEFTRHQRETFAQLVAALAKTRRPFDWVHASNSGGLLLERDNLCNTARPGLLVYGIVPDAQRAIDAAIASRYRPALNWKCRVSFVKEIRTGTSISYGHTFIAKKSMRVATITAGYGDGYLRAASNRSQVLIGGKRCRLLGRVTMDQMVVDVSGLTPVVAGDEVVLIGQQDKAAITAKELAAWCDTVPWEILTNITYRVPRVYRGGNAA